MCPLRLPVRPTLLLPLLPLPPMTVMIVSMMLLLHLLLCPSLRPAWFSRDNYNRGSSNSSSSSYPDQMRRGGRRHGRFRPLHHC